MNGKKREWRKRAAAVNDDDELVDYFFRIFETFKMNACRVSGRRRCAWKQRIDGQHVCQERERERGRKIERWRERNEWGDHPFGHNWLKFSSVLVFHFSRSACRWRQSAEPFNGGKAKANRQKDNKKRKSVHSPVWPKHIHNKIQTHRTHTHSYQDIYSSSKVFLPLNG